MNYSTLNFRNCAGRNEISGTFSVTHCRRGRKPRSGSAHDIRRRPAPTCRRRPALRQAPLGGRVVQSSSGISAAAKACKEVASLPCCFRRSLRQSTNNIEWCVISTPAFHRGINDGKRKMPDSGRESGIRAQCLQAGLAHRAQAGDGGMSGHAPRLTRSALHGRRGRPG